MFQHSTVSHNPKLSQHLIPLNIKVQLTLNFLTIQQYPTSWNFRNHRCLKTSGCNSQHIVLSTSNNKSQHETSTTLDFSQHQNSTRNTNFLQHPKRSHNTKLLQHWMPINAKFQSATLTKNSCKTRWSSASEFNPQHTVFPTSNNISHHKTAATLDVSHHRFQPAALEFPNIQQHITT